MNKAALALSAVLALAACNDDEDGNAQATQNQTQTETPAESAEASWDMQYVVDLENIEVVLPDNRLFHLDVTAFVPSVITEDMTMEAYADAARNVIRDKAQYYVDVYACRGHGDTFYAYMPTSTPEAELPFTAATTVDEVNPDVLFSVENMHKRYENFGSDEFTVNRTQYIGDREYSHESAMESYIAEGRGSHKTQEPTCSANFTKNTGALAP